MRELVGARQEPAVVWILGALGLLSLAVVSGVGPAIAVVGPLVVLVTVFAVSHRSLLGWDRVVALILVVVLFVPIGRYHFAVNLPVGLELYRLVVAFALVLWGTSLLIDSKVRLQRTVFDWPLLLIFACVLCSELMNPQRVSANGTHVLKALSFLLSYVLVYYLAATALRSLTNVIFLLKLLTVSGAFIGIAAVYELRTHYNLFDHLHTVLPILSFTGPVKYLEVGGNIRVIGPSQQPIAFGAAMTMLLPFAIYFARITGRRRWWVVALLIALGVMASGSRTAMLMLAAMVGVFLWLKPVETRRLWPAIFPALVVIHFALPGTIGGLKDSFFPKGGLIADQSRFHSDYDPLLAGGRIRLISPMLSEASRYPLFGEGYGTRITGFDEPDRNAPILDNQWLNNIMDVGFVGFGAWIWLMVRATRRLGRASKSSGEDGSGDDWLFTAFTASIAGFAIGMLTFDAFHFTQVTFFFWILLALAAVALRLQTESGGAAVLESADKYRRSAPAPSRQG